MTRSEAEEYREKLMAERTVVVDENTRGYFAMVRTRICLVLTKESTVVWEFDMWYVSDFNLFRRVIIVTAFSEH